MPRPTTPEAKKPENTNPEITATPENANTEVDTAIIQKLVQEQVAAVLKDMDKGNAHPQTDKKAVNEWLEEYVWVKLFKDNGKYKDDVFVAVNGVGCRIMRGEKVKIKRKFALVLDQSDLQDYQASKLIEEKSEKVKVEPDNF